MIKSRVRMNATRSDLQIERRSYKEMATIGESAKAFIPKQTKNIADLNEVLVSCELHHDGKGIDNNGVEFQYSYLFLNNEEYRVPASVIGQLKDLLEENKNLTKFRVKRSGEGLKTRYTVIPLG